MGSSELLLDTCFVARTLGQHPILNNRHFELNAIHIASRHDDGEKENFAAYLGVSMAWKFRASSPQNIIISS